jgi:hypothetical protein
MKSRFKFTRRRGNMGCLDTKTGTWSLVFIQDNASAEDKAEYLRLQEARARRKEFYCVAGNDWALPNPDKSPRLSLVMGGAA